MYRYLKPYTRFGKYFVLFLIPSLNSFSHSWTFCLLTAWKNIFPPFLLGMLKCAPFFIIISYISFNSFSTTKIRVFEKLRFLFARMHAFSALFKSLYKENKTETFSAISWSGKCLFTQKLPARKLQLFPPYFLQAVSSDFSAIRLKICRKYLLTENFLTRKLGEKSCILQGAMTWKLQ